MLGVTPLGWILTSDPPRSQEWSADPAAQDEHKGQDLGGKPPASPEVSADPDSDGATLVEALRSQAFWAFGIAMSLYGLIASGISLFNESILDERGFGRDVYLEVVEKTAYMALGFNFLAG